MYFLTPNFLIPRRFYTAQPPPPAACRLHFQRGSSTAKTSSLVHRCKGGFKVFLEPLFGCSDKGGSGCRSRRTVEDSPVLPATLAWNFSETEFRLRNAKPFPPERTPPHPSGATVKNGWSHVKCGIEFRRGSVAHQGTSFFPKKTGVQFHIVELWLPQTAVTAHSGLHETQTQPNLGSNLFHYDHPNTGRFRSLPRRAP